MRGWSRISPMTSHQGRYLPALIAISLAACLLGISLLTCSGPLWPEALAELVFVAVVGLLFRSVRAGVYADRERLRIRSLWGTRTVGLTEISSITSAPRHGDDHDPLRSDVLQIVLKDGEIIRTPLRIRNPLEGTRLSGAVYERDEYLRIKNHLGALVHNRAFDDAVPQRRRRHR